MIHIINTKGMHLKDSVISMSNIYINKNGHNISRSMTKYDERMEDDQIAVNLSVHTNAVSFSQAQ